MNKPLKIVAIITFLSIAIMSLIAGSNPAMGYELSIYDATPWIIWFLLVFVVLSGIALVVHQIYTKRIEDSNLWVIGICMLVLSKVFLFYLPFIRGYVIWMGDTISHIGLMRDILFTGHYYSENFYPLVHILPAELINIANLSHFGGYIFVNAFVYIFYIVAIYLLATVVLPKKEQQILVLLIVATVDPLHGWFHISVYITPLVFYFYLKRESIRFFILFILFILILPFFHVLSAFIVILSILALEISRKVVFRMKENDERVTKRPRSIIYLIPLTIVSFILIYWIMSFDFFSYNLQVLLTQVTNATGHNLIAEIQSKLNALDVTTIGFLELLIRMYGVNILFISLSIVTSYFVVKKIRDKVRQNENMNLFSLLAVFYLMGVLYFFYIIGVPGITAIQPARLMSFIMIFTPLFVAYFLFKASRVIRFSHVAAIGIVCLVLLSSILGIFNAYDSPYTLLPNNQISNMDMIGMQWYFDEKDFDVGCVDIITPVGRFAAGILGFIGAQERGDLDWGQYYSENIPDHFAYNQFNSTGHYYDVDKYIAITESDRLIYTTLWQTIGRFTNEDFVQFEHDINVDKLYSNGELEVYFIKHQVA